MFEKTGKIEIEKLDIGELDMKKSIPTVLGDKKSCLTVADEKEYGKLVKQTKVFWKYLDEQIALRPWCSLVKAEKSDGVRLRRKGNIIKA